MREASHIHSNKSPLVIYQAQDPATGTNDELTTRTSITKHKYVDTWVNKIACPHGIYIQSVGRQIKTYQAGKNV